MSKEQIEEIKNFLIYLHLVIMASKQELNGDGYIAISELINQYPQFTKIKQENQKIFEWLEKGEQQ